MGQRVVWPHQERVAGVGRPYREVRTAGTVMAVDVPGLPPGARVLFDEPVLGSWTCYAAHWELEWVDATP